MDTRHKYYVPKLCLMPMKFCLTYYTNHSFHLQIFLTNL